MASYAEYIIKMRDQFSAPMKNIQSALNKTDLAVGKVNNDLSKTKDQTVRAANGFNRLKNAVGAYVGVASAVASIKAAAQMQGMEVSINALSGSAKEGGKNLDFISGLSDKLGLDLVAATEGFKLLQGGFMGTGVQGEKLRKVFEGVASASSVMQLGADKQKLVFLALGQMAAKGKVSSEEMRQQLAESLPQAMAVGAKSMGMSIAQFQKAMEAGKIASADFLPKFSAELQRDVAPGVAAASQSLTANLNRMGNEFLRLKVSIGDALSPVIPPLLDLMKRIGDSFSSNKGMLKGFMETIASFIPMLTEIGKRVGLFLGTFLLVNTAIKLGRIAVAAYTLTMGLLRGGMIGVAVAAKTMKASLVSSGVGIVVVLAGELVGWLMRMEERTGGVSAAFKGLSAWISTLYENMKLLFNADSYKGILTFFNKFGNVISELGSILHELVTAPLSKIPSLIKDVPSRLKTAIDIVPKENKDNVKFQSMSGAFNKAFNEGLKGKADGLKLPIPSAAQEVGGDPTGVGGAPQAVGGGLPASKVSGAAPKVFNINIEKLVENMSITTETMKEGAQDVRKMIEDALTQALGNVKSFAV